MSHMDEGQLQAWLDGPRSGLSEAERAEIEAHIASCDACAGRLDELRSTDEAAGELLGAVAAAEPVMPDFSEVVARSRALDGTEAKRNRPARRRLPLQWAASIVVAIGVGWMANEVARTDPGLVGPLERATPPASEVRPPVSEASDAAADEVDPASGTAEASAEARELAASAPPVTQESTAAPPPETAMRRTVVPPPMPAGDAIRPLPTGFERARNALDAARRPETTWVNGRVTDPEGLPLREVVVSITGTNRTALSGPDGRFRMPVPADSLGPDAELQATYIGYAVATRDIPVGRGELTVDDLRLEPRAVQLEGVVVTGTAIESQQREVPALNRVRIDGSEIWRPVTSDSAEAALGARPLSLPGIPWTEIGALTIGDVEVIRVTHETTTGDVVLLYQSRSGLDVEPAPELARADRLTEAGVNLLAVGPLDPDDLAELLRRAEPIDPTPSN